jgi:hypothetical protein
MEQEFPFLYPNHSNMVEAVPAWAPKEDVGMIRRWSDDVMMPWSSSMLMMY